MQVPRPRAHLHRPPPLLRRRLNPRSLLPPMSRLRLRPRTKERRFLRPPPLLNLRPPRRFPSRSKPGTRGRGRLRSQRALPLLRPPLQLRMRPPPPWPRPPPPPWPRLPPRRLPPPPGLLPLPGGRRPPLPPPPRRPPPRRQFRPRRPRRRQLPRLPPPGRTTENPPPTSPWSWEPEGPSPYQPNPGLSSWSSGRSGDRRVNGSCPLSTVWPPSTRIAWRSWPLPGRRP